MTITKKELNEIFKKHDRWLSGEDGGECANLKCVDLSHADLRNVNLMGIDLQNVNLQLADCRGALLAGADLRGANLQGADLQDADLVGADLRDANLKYANLTGVDLRGANLQGANLDYSSLPLWCGSLDAHFDDYQLRQIAYHLVKAGLYSKNASRETKFELARLIDFANEFHRADECGKIT